MVIPDIQRFSSNTLAILGFVMFVSISYPRIYT